MPSSSSLFTDSSESKKTDLKGRSRTRNWLVGWSFQRGRYANPAHLHLILSGWHELILNPAHSPAEANTALSPFILIMMLDHYFLWSSTEFRTKLLLLSTSHHRHSVSPALTSAGEMEYNNSEGRNNRSGRTGTMSHFLYVVILLKNKSVFVSNDGYQTVYPSDCCAPIKIKQVILLFWF